MIRFLKHCFPLAVVLLAFIGCEEGDGADPFDDDPEWYEEAGDVGSVQFPAGLASGDLGLNDVYSTTTSAGSTGTRMYATATATTVLKLLAPNVAVKIVIAAPSNGRYRVHHAGVLGWIAAADLTFNYSYPKNLPLSQTRIEALARARQGMGFSYWWGNARWNSDGGAIMGTTRNTGSCAGSCPDCTHAATGGGTEYGADCAGFVSTIWGFPDFDPMTNPTYNGYTAGRYYQSNPNWQTVSVAEALPGDARVSMKHIYLVATRRDAAGYIQTFECVSCATGCKSVRRSVPTISTTAHMIRRVGW